MKIFDSSPGIHLERPRRRRTIAVVVAGALLYLVLGGALVYQHMHHADQLATASRELAATRSEATRLQARLTAAREELDATAANEKHCSGSLHAETAKIAAFAKQAAACEIIRTRLHLKG